MTEKRKDLIRVGNKTQLFPRISECEQEACPIHESCPYMRESAICRVESAFVGQVIGWLDPVTGIGDRVDNITATRFGSEVLPQYKYLFRLMRSEKAIRGDVVYKCKGKVLVYPQYKEIREISKTITLLLDSLKIREQWLNKFGRTMDVAPNLDEIMEKGSPGAYEEMARAAAKEEDTSEEEDNHDDEDEER